MQIGLIILLFVVGTLTWVAWRKPRGWLSRMSPRETFFVTLGGAALMAGLFAVGDPQNTRILAPLMALMFGIAIASRYYNMRRKAS